MAIRSLRQVNGKMCFFLDERQVSREEFHKDWTAYSAPVQAPLPTVTTTGPSTTFQTGTPTITRDPVPDVTPEPAPQSERLDPVVTKKGKK